MFLLQNREGIYPGLREWELGNYGIVKARSCYFVYRALGKGNYLHELVD